MQGLNPSGTLRIGASDLEYRMIGPAPSEAPAIVMLHEGLGSAALWGDFPDKLQAATGFGVFAYSRAGYGASSPVPLPRPLDYMHVEALEVLPKLLDAIGFRRGLLLGHSDGASIATIYAGGVQDHRVQGVVLIAPHFIVEDISVASIAEIRNVYETTDLKSKLQRWHSDVDNAFYGWNSAWLDPSFRDWDISEYLAYIRVPVAILQGAEDQYGTIRQIEIAQQECYCPVEVTIVPGAGHSPNRDAPEATLDAISDFVGRILDADQGSRGQAA
jgi:pimeloyl-ACP methyl ester carboxylesterase